MIREPDRVVLKRDLGARGARSGDVGATVLSRKGGAAFEVEFAPFVGDTAAIVTVDAADLRAASLREIRHARGLA